MNLLRSRAAAAATEMFRSSNTVRYGTSLYDEHDQKIIIIIEQILY